MVYKCNYLYTCCLIHVTFLLLGGLKPHIDPLGYESNRVIPNDAAALVQSGDYFATFMVWLSNVMSGGATSFIFPGEEMTVMPNEGAAAFWINLSCSHQIDDRLMHGGCPVIVGKKTILNKWIYSFDQWKMWPCSNQKDDFFTFEQTFNTG